MRFGSEPHVVAALRDDGVPVSAEELGRLQEIPTGFLQAILADNPADVQAWLWLSGVVDAPAEQVAALERVLELARPVKT